MRLAARPFVPLMLLLVDCGSRQDLIIGERLVPAEAGSAGSSTAGVGADATGGTSVAPAGSGGTAEVGGTTDAGGTDSTEAGAPSGGTGTTDEDCIVGDEPPLGSLIHRYAFEGIGTVATDDIAGANGTVVKATLNGMGKVVMSGADGEYVDLPNGIISSLTDVTLVTWTNWGFTAAYGRVFDFGSNENGEGEGNTGKNYLAVMPMTGFEMQTKPGLGAEIKVPGFPTVTLASTENMKDRAAQVSLVIRGGVSASLYIDGNLLATKPTAITLADIDDRNNWIGQSQYKDNPPYDGGFEEFRIYDAPLTSCQLHTLLVRGPTRPFP
ncbi:MAG TPA: LamG-like jellyroll fold domain-containing protein [Polyangiaceae bacterium]|nr:LamG-like jellyroll fold domain-containing protein [Polyangiaceae bacterium]